MDGKIKLVAMAALGFVAFVGGRAKGHVSGVRHALSRVENLRRLAECRPGEEGCEWVYSQGHPRAGDPFGEHPGGDLHPAERHVRRYRPFAGLPLLETVEFDVARPLPREMRPTGMPPWWEEHVDDPRADEYREWMRREDEGVNRQKWALRRLRHGRWAGLQAEARWRLGQRVGADRSLHLDFEAHNDAPVPLEFTGLRLTYLYRNPAIERLRGRAAPRMPLPEFEEGSIKVVLPGEVLRWSVEFEDATKRLAEHGMTAWPVFTLPRPGGVLYRLLPNMGRDGRIAMERLKKLAFRYLAVELVDGRGGTRKVKAKLIPS